jgi:hypothetical protein
MEPSEATRVVYLNNPEFTKENANPKPKQQLGMFI